MGNANAGGSVALSPGQKPGIRRRVLAVILPFLLPTHCRVALGPALRSLPSRQGRPCLGGPVRLAGRGQFWEGGRGRGGGAGAWPAEPGPVPLRQCPGAARRRAPAPPPRPPRPSRGLRTARAPAPQACLRQLCPHGAWGPGPDPGAAGVGVGVGGESGAGGVPGLLGPESGGRARACAGQSAGAGI